MDMTTYIGEQRARLTKDFEAQKAQIATCKETMAQIQGAFAQLRLIEDAQKADALAAQAQAETPVAPPEPQHARRAMKARRTGNGLAEAARG